MDYTVKNNLDLEIDVNVRSDDRGLIVSLGTGVPQSPKPQVTFTCLDNLETPEPGFTWRVHNGFIYEIAIDFVSIENSRWLIRIRSGPETIDPAKMVAVRESCLSRMEMLQCSNPQSQ